MMEETLGWVGNFYFVIGVFFLGKKMVHGFWANVLANMLYAVQAYLMNNNSLLCISVVLICLNLIGIYEWRKK